MFFVELLVPSMDVLFGKKLGISVNNPGGYYCARREKFAHCLIEMSYPRRRFLWIDTTFTPPTHNFLAKSCSDLEHCIKKGELPDPFSCSAILRSLARAEFSLARHASINGYFNF